MGDGIGKILPYENEIESNATRCLQRCDTQTDSLVLTSTQFPSRTSFQSSRTVCYTFEKIVRICKGDKFRSALLELHYSNFKCSDIEQINYNSTFCSEEFVPNYVMIARNPKLLDFLLQYAQENIGRLTIYIKEPFYSQIKRDEQTSIISFIGNVGGLLGLCLGLSMISIFEIIYFCLKLLITKLQWINGQALNWLNLSIDMYKVNCKKLLLSFWINIQFNSIMYLVSYYRKHIVVILSRWKTFLWVLNYLVIFIIQAVARITRLAYISV